MEICSRFRFNLIQFRLYDSHGFAPFFFDDAAVLFISCQLFKKKISTG